MTLGPEKQRRIERVAAIPASQLLDRLAEEEGKKKVALELRKRTQEDVLEPFWACRSPRELDDVVPELAWRYIQVCGEVFSVAGPGFLQEATDAMAGPEGALSTLMAEPIRRAEREVSREAGGWLEFAWRTAIDVARLQPATRLPALDGSVLEEFTRAMSNGDPALGVFGQFGLYLDAASWALRADMPLPPLIEEVCLRAYGRAGAIIDLFARLGVRIDPYRGESVRARGERVLRLLGTLSRALSEEDFEALKNARLPTMGRPEGLR